VADALVYFRPIDSRIRPYLGTGVAVVRFSASVVESTTSGLNAPVGEISSTRAALRSHVGIDISLSSRTAFRYSFSETIGGNPISPHLTPAGERGLANFQNLFGMVMRF
jgi:opacity protein-like surface antigen